LIDTHNWLVCGLDQDWQKTGNIYNKHISGGEFFSVPAGDTYMLELNGFSLQKVDYKY
jgi:hypothetical protein